jgi:hypothetical protein
MTILSGGLNTTGSICRKQEKIGKVTGSQDDDFVGGLNTTGSICRKHEKIEKVTGSQDDDFCGSFESFKARSSPFVHPPNSKTCCH